MKNLLFIQSDKFGNDDYLFVDNKLILNKSEVIEIVSSNKLLKGRLDFLIKKAKNPLVEVIKKNPFGYLITGELNDLDFGHRKMSFTCLYNGDIKYLEEYFKLCLGQIEKSINSESLRIIYKTIADFNKVKNISIIILVSAISIYLAYKFI